MSYTITLDTTATLGSAAVLLLAGRGIKMLLPALKKFFIPSPVIGGMLFALVSLVGHLTETFDFAFDSDLKDLLMMVFFTSIGFMASVKMLKTGGPAVALFIIASTMLICLQNIAGTSVAVIFDENPLLGLATGSISMSGGHGTSAAFGPELEKYGLAGGLSISVACATFGLIAGSMIGGPVGRFLLLRKKLKPAAMRNEKYDPVAEPSTRISERSLMEGAICIAMAVAIGTALIRLLKGYDVTMPAYLGPMVIAALIRNLADMRKKDISLDAVETIGNVSLQFFLAMALMNLRLWELADLALPLLTILFIQTVVTILFAVYVTFNIMGRDYDAAVIACGHCGFAMGATPNAMANMETFTGANGKSPKAFFVVPMVGALFIDFINAIVISVGMRIIA